MSQFLYYPSYYNQEQTFFENPDTDERKPGYVNDSIHSPLMTFDKLPEILLYHYRLIPLSYFVASYEKSSFAPPGVVFSMNTSRGFAPSPGPMTPFSSMISKRRAARA